MQLQQLQVSSSSDEPRRQVGRFVLLEEIGVGAKSVVYRAQEAGSGREVALKIIKLRGSSMDKQRVRREVEVRDMLHSLSCEHTCDFLVHAAATSVKASQHCKGIAVVTHA